jgi:hypothetical protein
VQDGSGQAGWLSGDPCLGPIQDNGGPTQTIALLPGSPAIDAGDNSLIPSGITTDQRGGPRIVNGVTDLGAFEYLPTGLTGVSLVPGPDISATEGTSTGPVVVAAFTDTNPASQLADFSASIAWGDGSNSPGAISYDPGTGTYSVTGSHSYAEGGNYVVTGSITAGDSSTASTHVAVNVTVPTLAVQPTPMLNLGVTNQGTAGSVQTYTISGCNLTAIVVLTAPAGVELSTDSINYHGSLTLTPSSGTLANTSICIRLSALAAAGNISGNITVTSTGAAEQDVAFSGTVRSLPTILVTDAGGMYNGNPFAVTAASVIAKDGSAVASFGNPLLSYMYFKGITRLPGAPSAAGSYFVVAHFAGNAKQGSLYSAPVAFVIAPAAITFNIANDRQTYGHPVNFAYDLGTLLSTGINGERLRVTYSSAGDTAKAHVNTYPITASVGNGTGLVANYVVTFKIGTLTVNPYAFIFTIPNDNRYYASTINLALDLGTTINTRVNGENLRIVYSSVGTAPSCAVGKYMITGMLSSSTGALPDYSVTLYTGTLTIISRA